MHDDAQVGQLALRLAQVSELSALLTLVTDWVCQKLDTPDCVIYLVEKLDESPSLVQSAAWGCKRHAVLGVADPLRLAFGEGVVGAAAQSATSQLVADTHADQRHIADTGSGRSELAVPIVVQGEVIGVIDSEHPKPSHYRERERLALEQICALVGGHLQASMTAARLKSSLASQAELSSRLRSAVMTDPLTGLANRRAVERELGDRVAEGRSVWACVFDLDGFKGINDTHGHAAGDEALRTIGQVMQTRLGAHPGTVVARTGGDEFVVVTTAPIEQLHVSLRTVLDEIPFVSAHLGHVSASVGISSGADRAVVRRADDAMTIAKELGGNRIIDYANVPDRIARLEEHRSWRERVAVLLDSDDLYLHFQPIVPLDPAAVPAPIAYEALLRIDDGKTRTSEFIDAVTHYRQDVALDQRLLGHILDVLQVHPTLTIAHNWSPRSLDPGQGLVWTLLEELHRRQIDPSRLVIEVTEHTAIEHTKRFQVAVRSLRKEGVKIALDDLGAGWTSFKFLHETPVDIIKLDGEWTQQTRTNPIAEELVASTVRCAEHTGAEVVAEWIETEDQRQALQELGVTWGQGYLLGAPNALATWLDGTTTSTKFL